MASDTLAIIVLGFHVEAGIGGTSLKRWTFYAMSQGHASWCAIPLPRVACLLSLDHQAILAQIRELMAYPRCVGINGKGPGSDAVVYAALVQVDAFDR